MKKVLCALVAGLVFTSSVIANDESQTASKEMVANTLASCVEWAAEDEVSNEDMDKYLLECVNDVLTSNGFKAVSSVK
jgi:hypothetical protein